MKMETWIGRKETPCWAVVECYSPPRPGKYYGPWEDSYPDDDGYLDWHLETYKSSLPSHRLDIIATKEDVQRIESDLVTYLESRHDA